MIMKDQKHVVLKHHETPTFWQEFKEGLRMAFIALAIAYSFVGFFMWQ